MVGLSCDDDIAGGRSIGALRKGPFFVEALIYSSIVHFVIKLSYTWKDENKKTFFVTKVGSVRKSFKFS